MYNIVKSKTIAGVLLIVLITGLGQATKPSDLLTDITDQEIYLSGNPPKIGEVFEAVYRVRLKPDVKIGPGHIFYVKFSTGLPSFNAEILDKNEIALPTLIPGEWQEVRGRFRITEPNYKVFIRALLRVKGGGYGLTGASFRLYLADSLTGQYITGEEMAKRPISVLAKYRNIEPEWLPEPDRSWEESNREIAEKMREFEPALTDSEALCLHQDNYILFNNGIGKGPLENTDRIILLLEAGWLKAQRSGAEAKQKWLNDFIEKHRK